MSKPFLGIGVGFPIDVDEDGAIVPAAYEQSVHQSIWTILGTAKGERVMRPDFGCGIYEMVFELNTPTTAGKIARSVREALLQFEPRIDVLDVQVTPELTPRGQTLLIGIDYQVRSTNNVFNLVYPFYLERSPG